MWDSELHSRQKRIRAAPRFGTPAAADVLATVFSSGLAVVLEAYFFRCACSPDFYLLANEAEFRCVADKFRGDNPELYLYRIELILEHAPVLARWHDTHPDSLRQEVERVYGEKMSLLKCSRVGEMDRYFLLEADEDAEGFLAQDWVGWEITAYDAWEGTNRAKGAHLMPRSDEPVL